MNLRAKPDFKPSSEAPLLPTYKPAFEPPSLQSSETISRQTGDLSSIRRTISAVTMFDGETLLATQMPSGQVEAAVVSFSPANGEAQGVSLVYITKKTVLDGVTDASPLIADAVNLTPYFHRDPAIKALLVECRGRFFARNLWTYYQDPANLTSKQVLGDVAAFSDK